MAGSDELVFEGSPNSPPRPFAVAAWLDMSPEAIRAGIADGSIAPPPGAMPDWEPPRSITVLGHVASDPPLAGNATVDDISVALSRSQVSGLFRALDSALTDVAFDAIWNRAGDSDVARGANLTAYLSRTLFAAPSARQGGESGPNTNPTPKSLAELTAFAADPSHRVRVVDLAGMDGASLADLARTDVGYRYALAQLDSVALVGNRALFAGANIDSRLDRFDPDTGQVQLSDAWLADRGKFFAWKMAGDAGLSLGIDGDQSWTFVDRSKISDDGQPITTKLTAGASNAKENQVVFGAESAESIKGGTGTDRIYGGAGDDVLRGAGGADRLEGGRGDDIVSGGSGNDELVGNQGDDDLDGGRGADALDGGSGDDALTGGRGDDALIGGDGVDTYVIDAGDGTDTITDNDGLGTVSLDDEMLTGATLNPDGTWTSADGRLQYSFDGDLAGEGTLTIRAFEAGADHSGTPNNVVHVNSWHNGDLGITLGTGESTAPDAHDSDGSDTAPQIIADDIPVDGLSVPSTDSDSGSQIMADDIPLGGADLPTPATDPGSPALETDAGSSGIAASVANEAEATITPEPATIAPILVDAPPTMVSEIDDAISQLLAPPGNGFATLDPTRMQNALAAFSGVLAPPDVPFAGGNSEHMGNAVSIADMTGALADDAGGHDASSEAAAGPVQTSPDWHQIEGIAMPQHSSLRAVRGTDWC